MVAPHAGAWIETLTKRRTRQMQRMSRPTRARGLKHVVRKGGEIAQHVAPHAGAWIETGMPAAPRARILSGRAPRGRVD